RPSELRQLFESIGLEEREDIYEQARSLEIQRGSSRAATLLGFFGIPNEPDSGEIVEHVSKVTGMYELFPHQRTAVREAMVHLSDGDRRALLHTPTGSGKTRTAMSLAADFLRSHEPTCALWLAASEELCEQAADEFAKA